MPENNYDRKNLTEQNHLKVKTKNRPTHFLFVVFLLHNLVQMTVAQLPTKIINIQKSFQEVPIINLSDLSNELESVTLLMDTGSSELAIFDDQCDQCEHTFSACPHIKNQNNQTFISYLLTQFKGDYSYLTLGNSIRMRFFCVIQVQGSQNRLQTNGVLGIQIKKMNFIEKIIKETNGLKVWRQVIGKVYEQDIKSFQQAQNAIETKDVNQFGLSSVRLKYSIFYSHYHTKLILGEIPEIYSKKVIGQLSLSLQTKTNFLCYFPNDCNSDSTDSKKIQETIVHFDSGSSVIVLPWSQFQNLFAAINSSIQNQCFIQNMQIKCQKNSMNLLIDSGFKFKISLYQNDGNSTMINSVNLSIGLQNLIQKSHQNKKDSYFFLNFIGHKNTNQQSEEFIILGVPLFKQYLAQYDIPFESQKKGILQNLKNGMNPNEEYKLIFYDPRQKESGEMQSPYENLIKKYEKNIKIFTFFYLFFVFLFSYLVIKLYWWIDQFIKGKRQLV